jgi:hypothetical protein
LHKQWDIGGETSLGRPRRRGEDNIKMDHRKMGCEGEMLMELTLDLVECAGFHLTSVEDSNYTI